MKLKVIGSSSAGNAYILENDQEALLIECGVQIAKIKQALGYQVRKVAGCIVSHEHKDHCKSVKEILGLGINVYASYGTHQAMQTESHHRARFVHDGKVETIGGFKIKPFNVKHDAAEPFGYLINHAETGVVLFLTDSYYSEYKFSDLNNIIIEANYCQTILDRKVREGLNPKFLRDRVITSHMSLATCKDLLKANDLTQVNNIVLIHLSDGNSNAAQFKKEVGEVTGKPIYIAQPGLNIDFNKKPF